MDKSGWKPCCFIMADCTICGELRSTVIRICGGSVIRQVAIVTGIWSVVESTVVTIVTIGNSSVTSYKGGNYYDQKRKESIRIQYGIQHNLLENEQSCAQGL